MQRGRIQRNRFIPVMQQNRISANLWHRFLPDGGVPGVLNPDAPPADTDRVLVWFPHRGHLAGGPYSPLTWAGAGPNDTIESLLMPNSRGGVAIPVIPLVALGPEPALRIRFKHRVTGVDPDASWWSAVIGFAPGSVVPEWETVDLSPYDRIKIFVRAVAPPGEDLQSMPPIPLYFRFEDDHVDVPGRAQHRSSGWCRRPINVTHWSRPEVFSLSKDFPWGANAFWPDSPAVDRKRILQITFGMDGDVSDVDGDLEIQRIELLGHSDDSVTLENHTEPVR